MDRRALQSFWLYVEQPTQAHRPEIDHILVHKQVLDKLKYLKYYKIYSPTIKELNSKSIEEHYLENLQIFENSVTHFKISHESKKEIIREI